MKMLGFLAGYSLVGENIPEYGGTPDQIYRARAGLPLRTVYVECSQERISRFSSEYSSL